MVNFAPVQRGANARVHAGEVVEVDMGRWVAARVVQESREKNAVWLRVRAPNSPRLCLPYDSTRWRKWHPSAARPSRKAETRALGRRDDERWEEEADRRDPGRSERRSNKGATRAAAGPRNGARPHAWPRRADDSNDDERAAGTVMYKGLRGAAAEALLASERAAFEENAWPPPLRTFDGFRLRAASDESECVDTCDTESRFSADSYAESWESQDSLPSLAPMPRAVLRASPPSATSRANAAAAASKPSSAQGPAASLAGAWGPVSIPAGHYVNARRGTVRQMINGPASFIVDGDMAILSGPHPLAGAAAHLEPIDVSQHTFTLP